MIGRILSLLLFTSLILFHCGSEKKTFIMHFSTHGFDRGVTVEEVNHNGFIFTGYTSGSGAGGENVFWLERRHPAIPCGQKRMEVKEKIMDGQSEKLMMVDLL